MDATGEVDRVTAGCINAAIREGVSASEVLGQLAPAVRRTVELIEALDPDAEDLRVQIDRFSETLKAFTIALDMLRILGAPTSWLPKSKRCWRAGAPG